MDALFRELLISVTSFFRDPEAFEALATQVIPKLLADGAADSVIRVWVPGCSTGEEVFSIAISVAGEARRAQADLPSAGIRHRHRRRKPSIRARAGVYADGIATDVTPERLARHFTHLEGDTYRVHKFIRDLLIFSEQDVAKDPPFSRLDLISCRNLDDLHGPGAAKEAHSALSLCIERGGHPVSRHLRDGGRVRTPVFPHRPQGEDLSAHGRRTRPRPAPRARALFRGREHPFQPRSAKKISPGETEISLREITERALLEDAPVAALVNERGEILYIHGQTGQFLAPAPGEIGVNILKMAREGLRHDLTTALRLAVSHEEMRRPPRRCA